MFLDTLSFSFFVSRKPDLINFAKNELCVIPVVLLYIIYLSPRFNFIRYSLAKSRAFAWFMYSSSRFSTSENDDVSNWRNYDCLYYLVSRAALHTEEQEIRNSRLRLFLSRWLFLKVEFSLVNEPRAREIIRAARDGKFAACDFISREEFVILKFLCKYVLTPQTFSCISLWGRNMQISILHQRPILILKYLV